MGWKGTVRSIGAAVRAAERDAKRRQRELEKRQKQYAKMQELEQAEYEVDEYENHIEVIQSLHKECCDRVDWEYIAGSSEPKKPKNTKACESAARREYEDYKPGLIDRIFKREEKKRKGLSEKILEAVKEDDAKYQAALAKWETNVNEWSEQVATAQLLLNGDGEAKLKTIKKLDPFSEIAALGSSVSFTIGTQGLIEATINIHGKNIVPSDIKSLLKNGKLSVKKMPQGQFNEIYQDYVCSCILRVGNELFSVLPDRMVIVTAVDELLNTKTGHLEKSPIVSACISRKTLESLNMDRIDPSDSMKNFVHNMAFKKNTGFEAVEKIQADALELNA